MPQQSLRRVPRRQGRSTSTYQASAGFMFTDVPLANASHVLMPRINVTGVGNSMAAQRSDSLGNITYPCTTHVKRQAEKSDKGRHQTRSHWRELPKINLKGKIRQQGREFLEGKGASVKCHRQNKQGSNEKCPSAVVFVNFFSFKCWG